MADARGLDGEALVRTSRLTARIDNNAIADGFQIYLHTFVVTRRRRVGRRAAGHERASTGLARRYHWHSATVRDFTSPSRTPASSASTQGMIHEPGGRARAAPAQDALLAIARTRIPSATLAEARRSCAMPAHHDVRAENVDLKRLGAVLAVAYERDLRDFASLLLLENLGPRTLQSLALVAEVVHGAPARFSDPARFSFAHGGKDGHPFPVPLKTYDESIAVLRRSLDAAKLGDDGQARRHAAAGPVRARGRNRRQPEADFDCGDRARASDLARARTAALCSTTNRANASLRSSSSTGRIPRCRSPLVTAVKLPQPTYAV